MYGKNNTTGEVVTASIRPPSSIKNSIKTFYKNIVIVRPLD